MAKLYTLPKELHPNFGSPRVKPTGPVEVDWGIFRKGEVPNGDVVLLCDSLTPRNLASPVQFDRITTTPSGWSMKGGNLSISGAHDAEYLKQPVTRNLATSPYNFTCSVRFKIPSFTTTVGIWQFGNALGDSSPALYMRIVHPSGEVFIYVEGYNLRSGSNLLGSDEWVTLTVGGRDSDGYLALYWNGIRVDSYDGGVSWDNTAADNQIWLNNGFNDASTDEVVYEYFTWQFVTLSDQEIWDQYIDPYQILKPAIPMSYFVPEAAAGTAVPIAAYHHNHNVGSNL